MWALPFLKESLHWLHSVAWPLAFSVSLLIVVRNAKRASSTSKTTSKTSTAIGPLPDEALDSLFRSAVFGHRVGMLGETADARTRR